MANVGDDAALFADRDHTLFDAPVAEDDEPCGVVRHGTNVTRQLTPQAAEVPTNEKTPRRFERGALKATEVAGSDYAALAANFPRSVLVNRASFPFSLISLSIAE